MEQQERVNVPMGIGPSRDYNTAIWKIEDWLKEASLVTEPNQRLSIGGLAEHLAIPFEKAFAALFYIAKDNKVQLFIEAMCDGKECHYFGETPLKQNEQGQDIFDISHIIMKEMDCPVCGTTQVLDTSHLFINFRIAPDYQAFVKRKQRERLQIRFPRSV